MPKDELKLGLVVQVYAVDDGAPVLLVQSSGRDI